MPRRTANLLLHPWRYPEWGELTLAMMGGLQFVWALSVFGDWDLRPGLALTVYLSPESWTAAGLVLALMHLAALRFGGARHGHTWRVLATGSSLAFWAHFVLTILINAISTTALIPASVIPATAAPLLAAAVLYRLWRHY